MAKAMDSNLDIFGATHVGHKRKVNEDQFFTARLRKSLEIRGTSVENIPNLERLRGANAEMFVVADGVGSAGAGDVASGTAIQALAGYIGEVVDCCYVHDMNLEHEFMEHLEESFTRAHEAVTQEFGIGEGKRGPATTLTLVTLVWPRAYIVHVGDSRCYYQRDKKLQQLTEDQTMGEAMMDAGVMTEEQVEKAGLDNILTSAIGANMEPRLGLIDLEPGDSMILCSDGLTKHVTDDQISEALSRGQSAEDTCKSLVQSALDGGGTDNITVIVVRAGA